MLIIQQPAFVLHARAYRETSLLLECLTRDYGRLGVVARGVRGTRSRLQRSELEPFQSRTLDLHLRGELATLRGIESTGAVMRLRGDALLSGLYVNELVVRMCARQDVQSGLFGAYASTLRKLEVDDTPSWTLRCFERELLQSLGYAMQLCVEADGERPVEVGVWYRYLPERGPQRCPPDTPYTVCGDDLLALAKNCSPDSEALRRLQVMMRGVLRFHLGGVELRAWRLLRSGLPHRF